MSSRAKKTGTALIATILIGLGGVVGMNVASSPPEGVGTAQSHLAPCPDSPNCVSTDAISADQTLEPLPIANTDEQTIKLLSDVVSELPGSRSVLRKDNYLHVEFRSPWLRFVDDVEFLIDGQGEFVHARSASRVGRSDMGVNRQRLEEIRNRYTAALAKIEQQAEQTAASSEEGETGMPEQIDEFATIEKSDEEWQRLLSREQYYVTRKHGTERRFTGPNWDTKDPGLYSCVCCELPLFSSETKYESGTGWPSFWNPLKETSVETQIDSSLFSRRVEVHCRRCKAHLGHVFEDGPEPTGLRYCMNGVAMKFHPAEQEAGAGDKSAKEE